MRKLSLLLLLSLTAQAGPPSSPGQVLYVKICARCHGKNGRLGFSGAHDLTKSNLNAMGRTYMVAKGLGKMPSFEKQLTPEQIQAVVAYSLTLH